MKKKQDEQSQKWWELAKKTREEVEKWPEWKKKARFLNRQAQ